MNVGSARGSGGGGLAGHWLKAKNESVVAKDPRFIAASTTRKQVAALTAATAHATFKNPIAHFWLPPNPSDRKPTDVEKADLVARLEREFHLEDQPRIGVTHVLKRDMETSGKDRHPSWEGQDEHDHLAYSLANDRGQAVDHMRQSFIRQERVIVEWQAANGFQITPCKHVTPVLAHLDQHNPDAAATLRAAGFRSKNDPEPSPAAIATYRTGERAQMERSPAVQSAKKTAHAFNSRKDVLAAWKSGDNGKAFEAALSERGYRLAQGDTSAMIIDPAGIEHRATEILGTAGRKLDGKAIAAADVHARLDGLELPPLRQARQAMLDAAPPAVVIQQIPPTGITVSVGHEAFLEDDDEQHREGADVLVGGRNQAGIVGDGGSGRVASDRPARSDSDPVRHPEDDRVGGPVVGTAPVAGAAGGQGTVPDRDAGGPGRADGSQPDQGGGISSQERAAFAADRLRLRRQAKGIGEAVGRRSASIKDLTRRLAGIPDRMLAEQRRRRIEHALATSEARVSAVLRADPRRSLAAVRDELADRHAGQFEGIRKAARIARDRATDAAGRLGILDRAIGVLGFRSEAMKHVERLDQQAEAARHAFEAAGEAYNNELEAEHARAPAIVRERKRQHDEWQQRPEVVQAMREQQANRLIWTAIGTGDSEIEQLARKDLKQAQFEVLQREVDDRRVEEQRLSNAGMARQSAHPLGARKL